MQFKLVIFTFLLALSPFITADNWELKLDKEGIKVYTKKVAGSKLKDFKGITTVNISMGKIVAVLKDSPSLTEWMPDCVESKVLKKISDNEYYTYAVTDVPWPISDRDSVVKCTIEEKSTGVVVFHAVGMPEYIPAKKGMVRVPVIKSYWQLTPKKGDKVEVEYFVHSDPGGKIPDSVINAAAVDQPFKTLKGLKKYLNR